MDILETLDIRVVIIVGYLVIALVVFLASVWTGLRWDGSHNNFYRFYIGVRFDTTPRYAIGLCFAGGVLWFPMMVSHCGAELYLWYRFRKAKKTPTHESFASAAEKAQQQAAARADRSKR